MTSSAASLTDSARKRVSGARRASAASPRRRRRRAGARRAARRRAGAAAIAATASSTSAASASTSTDRRRPRPARRGRRPRNIAWSSTMTTRTGACGCVAHSSSSCRARCRGRCSRTSVPSPGVGPDLGGAAVPVHPVDDAVADARAGPPGRRPGRSRRRGRGRRRRPRDGGDLGVDVDPAGAGVLGGVGHRLAGRVARPARSASSKAQSPTATTSTSTPWASSTSAAIAAQRAGEVLVGVLASPSNSQDRRSRSCGAGQPGDGGGVVRRSSGSGPGSAAPSRAGGRPCRRAPGCAPARRARRSRSEASR